MERDLFLIWAELLTYPGGRRADRVEFWIEGLCAARSELSAHLEPLRAWLGEHGGDALEELFVRTFENNKERALELGWHLYGENYARGNFMARMRQVLRESGIEEGVELPDHVTHVLRILARAEEGLAAALARGVVCQALASIEKGFSSADNPYRGLISGLNAHVRSCFGLEQRAPLS